MTDAGPAHPAHPVFQVDAEISLDYVLATVFGVDVEELVSHLAAELHLQPQTVRTFKDYRGYTSAVGLFLGGERQVTVQSGGQQRPLVIAPGPIAGATTRALKGFDHQCSRKDVAVDVMDEDAFDVIVKVAHSKAMAADIKTNQIGDWLTPGSPKGRTFEVGHRRSPYYLRIYEHSKLHVGSEVNCRIEVEVKPEKSPGKLQLALLSPSEILGLSPFTLQLLREFGIQADQCRPARSRRHLTDLEVRTLHLAAQYGNTVRELLEHHHGDIGAVVSAILDAEQTLRDSKRRIREAAARPQAVPLICL